MKQFKVNNAKSIAHTSNADFLRFVRAKQIIGVDNAAPAITAPNINVIAGALQYIRPKAIETLTAHSVPLWKSHCWKNIAKPGNLKSILRAKTSLFQTNPVHPTF